MLNSSCVCDHRNFDSVNMAIKITIKFIHVLANSKYLSTVTAPVYNVLMRYCFARYWLLGSYY